jgi:hypothetical protein
MHECLDTFNGVVQHNPSSPVNAPAHTSAHYCDSLRVRIVKSTWCGTESCDVVF